MRSFLICFSLLAICLGGYAHHENPRQCQILVQDFGSLCQSLVPQQPVEKKKKKRPAALVASDSAPQADELLEEPTDEPEPSTTADPSWSREFVDQINAAHNGIHDEL